MAKDIDERLIELHRLHFKRIVSVLFRKCGNAELAKDIAQDTFETCIEKRDELVNHPNLAGWLYITAFNKLANEMKRARNRMEVPLDQIDILDSEDSLYKLEYDLPKELSDEEREIIIMRIEKRMCYAEIAEIKAIGEDAARQQFSRAFRKCKKYFEELSQNGGDEEK